MDLDIRTISVAISVVVVGNALIFTLAWRYAKSLRNIIGCWSLAQCLVGLGMVMIGLRNAIPDFFSVIVANACILGGQIAAQEGIAIYMEKRGYLRKLIWVILALAIMLIFIFTYEFSSLRYRIIVYSMAASFISVCSIMTLRVPSDDRNNPRLALMVLCGLHLLLMAFRIISAIIEGEYSGLLAAGKWQAWGMIGALSFYTNISLCFLWIIAHRLGLDVQHQALTDSLTGLANRRALDKMFDVLTSIKENDHIGLTLIDVDAFKQINDEIGHQAGDHYLTQIGQALARNLRASDHVFRYGGDEFVIITRNADEENLVHTAERLRQAIEGLSMTWQGKSLNSSISIGVALSGDQAGTIDDLMRTADEALYQAKKEGKNCIFFKK